MWHDDNNITNVTNTTDSCTGFSRAHPSHYLTGTARSIYRGKAIGTWGSQRNSTQYRGGECTDRAVRSNGHAFGRHPVRPSLLEEALYLTVHKAITLPNNFTKYDEYEPLTAIHWNKTCGPPLTANWNSGERCAACRHAKRSLEWSMVLAR
jgi:hypothetical protein